jgi:hypothetical protein
MKKLFVALCLLCALSLPDFAKAEVNGVYVTPKFLMSIMSTGNNSSDISAGGFSIFDTSTTSEVNRLFLLILMGCVLSGVSLFTICVTYQPALTDHLAPIALLGIYVAVVILYLLQKWVFYKLLGWMFLDSDTAKLSMESYYTLIYFATFYFLISTLVIVFMRLPLWGSLTLYLSVFLILRIFIFFKWIKLFSVKKYGLLRFFLYFCALEIVPIILAGAIVLIINELLILNL